MAKEALALVLAALLGGGAAAKQPVPELKRLCEYKVPKGWIHEDANASRETDPYVYLSHGRDSIKIILFGGEGSRQKNVEEFMASFEARGEEGPAPEAGTVRVAGRSVKLYRRITMEAVLEDPHWVGPPRYRRPVTDEFCVVPAGEKFFVLKYTVEGVPIPGRDQERKAWEAFLKSFRVRVKP